MRRLLVIDLQGKAQVDFGPTRIETEQSAEADVPLSQPLGKIQAPP